MDRWLRPLLSVRPSLSQCRRLGEEERETLLLSGTFLFVTSCTVRDRMYLNGLGETSPIGWTCGKRCISPCSSLKFWHCERWGVSSIDSGIISCTHAGLAGGSASGKTTVAKRIIESLGVPWVTLLSMDSFYKVLTPEQNEQAARCEYNFDHPGTCVCTMCVERGECPHCLFILHIVFGTR